MLRTSDRISGKEHFIKVVAESPWTAVCKVCREQVVWAKTITNPRWVLFDGRILPLTDTVSDGDVVYSYVPVEYVHWNHCVESDASDSRESERDAAAS